MGHRQEKYEPNHEIEEYDEPSATSVGARGSSDIVSDAGVKVPKFSNEASDESQPDGPVKSDSMYKDRFTGESCDECCSNRDGFVSWDVYPLEHPVMLSERGNARVKDQYPDELCATVDTDCQRMAIGADTLQRMNQLLPEDLKASLLKETHRFRSVHGSSVTNYVAIIPTSLGKKGSILKPAVFDTEESRKAPFLLSLPFLLHCKAVLHLDQSQGLRIHFKRYGFTVPCHLGPTGALRVPFVCFMHEQLESLRKAFEQFSKCTGSEFEVLRVTAVFGPEDTQQLGNEGSVSGTRNGLLGEQQEGKARASTSAVYSADDLAKAGDEGALPGDPGIRDGNQLDQGQGGAVQCLARKPTPEQEVGRDCRVRAGDQHGVRDGNRQCGDVPVHLRGTPPDVGRSSGNGQSAPLSAPPGLSPLDGEETRSQSRQNLLEMPNAQGTAMQVLPMDCLATNVDRRGGQEIQSERKSVNQDGINYAVGGQLERATEDTMPTSDYDESRIQCVCGKSEVPGMRQTTPRNHEEVTYTSKGGTTSESYSGGKRFEEQDAHSKRDCAIDDQESERWQLREPTHGGAASGVRGLQAVPGVPTHATCTTRSTVFQPTIDEIGSLEKQSERMIKQGDKACKQAQAALKRAEATWMKVMSLIRTADSTGESGLHVFQDKVLDISGRIKDQKELTKYAQVLQLDEKQARKVAELYNPNRFGPETKRYGLIAGQAFDLELGDDCLKRETQNEVRDYLKRVRPGLLVVCPRCTHFSIMQNMNLGRKTPEAMRKFLQDLRKSKVLLRFAVEMIELVLSYGGVFVFEQPVTSKAWQERWLARCLQRDDVQFAQGDQCMYGLAEKTDDGKKYYRKPTGWMTNSARIKENLSRSCDHNHDHQPVLGQHDRELRSRRAQHYPVELVRAILKGYRQHLELGPQEIRWLHYETLRGDIECNNWWLQQLEIADAEEMDQYIKKVIADEIANVEKEDTEEIMVTDELYAAEDENAEVAGAENGEPEGNRDEAERYLPRERPFTVEQLVRRAHNGLGHPSNKRLARILKSAGAKEEAVVAAKQLKCSVCEQHRPVRPARQATPPKELGTNEIVGVDTVYVEHPSGKRKIRGRCVST